MQSRCLPDGFREGSMGRRYAVAVIKKLIFGVACAVVALELFAWMTVPT